MTAPQLDSLDRQLIDVLSRDARVSNRRIAADLGITEGTVRSRIKRLQQERLIAFTAITDFRLASNTKLAFVSVSADVSSVREVARSIAEFSGVSGVLVTMGRFNIFVVCLFNELEDIAVLASDQILALPGVRHVETSIAVRTLKYNVQKVRITDLDHARVEVPA